MRNLLLATAAVLLIGAAPAKKLTPTDVIAAAPPNAWKTISPDDLLVIDLTRGGRVVVQLAPQFTPIHVANVRALARSGYWSEATIYRVQDNYVAQWGINESEKPWPKGVTASPRSTRVYSAGGLGLTPAGHGFSLSPLPHCAT